MREEVVSITERQFILNALGERKRVDGREALEYRRLSIKLGAEMGCAYVQLGNTKVLAQVSCCVVPPRDARPTDGIVESHVEFSPMAGLQFEAGGRTSMEAVEVNRLLERCLRDSRAVDTESLCIAAGEKVWKVRVDVRVLEHAGSVIDAVSVACMTALSHFRRPDVTVCGTDVTVHTLEERDAIPLSIHHMPLCVTVAFYSGGKYQLVDPTDREEKVMEGRLTVAMNKHREICMLQVTGSMLLLREQVTRCSNMAVVKVGKFTELIQEALAMDARARKTKTFVEPCFFSPSSVSLLPPEGKEDLLIHSCGGQEVVEADKEDNIVNMV